MNAATITIEPTVPPLTAAGLKWALEHAPVSILARVAIDSSSDWPAAHRRIAVIQANTEGARA